MGRIKTRVVLIRIMLIIAVMFPSINFAEPLLGNTSSPSGAEIDSETIVESVVNSPQKTIEKAQEFHNALKDKAYSIADKQGLWIPEGFFDGPHDDDMFVAMLRLIFGLPVDFMKDLVRGESNSSQVTTHITLPTFFARLMNSVGAVVILVVVMGSTVGFLAKRSMDISYLTTEKEEVFPFIFARGALGGLLTFPIPAIGGMSALQGFTLLVLLIGLGMASITIKYGIPYILTPNAIMQPQPHVAKFVDYVLEAKTCTMAEALTDKRNLQTYTGLDQGYEEETKYIAKGRSGNRLEVIKSIHFGIDKKGNCGSIVISKSTNSPSVKENEKIDAATTILLSEISAQVARDTFYELWQNPTINDIAIKLNGDVENIDFSNLAQTYADFRIIKQDEVIGNITNKVRESFSANIDGTSSIFEKYSEDIGNLGFMALGSFHTMLTYQQMQITQTLSDLFSEKNNPAWDTVTIDSKTGIVETIMNWLNNTPDHILQTREALRLFFNSAYKAKPDPDPKIRIDGVTNHFTNYDAAQSAGQSIIEIFRADSNGVVFPNPIIEMRSVGVTIINTATMAYIAYSAVDIATAGTGGVAKTMASKLGGSIIGSGGEKAGQLASMILLALIGVGWFYASVVPNIPYIMWSLAVFSYLSYCTSAVISAGWWGSALAIASPQNERSFAGRMHEGGNILLTLFLKPFLMTISFFLAMILNVALGYYLQWSLEASAVSASYGTFSLGSLFSILFINGIIMAAGLVKNHSLIWELPDHLQRMLGFRAGYEDQSHSNAQAQATQMSASLGGSIKEIASTSLKPSFNSGIT